MDDKVTTYQITVAGKVDPAFIHKLNNFKVFHAESGNTTLSTLVGSVSKQTELLEVFNALFDYQYELIFVKKVDH